jgi:hypothetical protein
LDIFTQLEVVPFFPLTLWLTTSILPSMSFTTHGLELTDTLVLEPTLPSGMIAAELVLSTTTEI